MLYIRYNIVFIAITTPKTNSNHILNTHFPHTKQINKEQTTFLLVFLGKSYLHVYLDAVVGYDNTRTAINCFDFVVSFGFIVGKVSCNKLGVLQR